MNVMENVTFSFVLQNGSRFIRLNTRICLWQYEVEPALDIFRIFRLVKITLKKFYTENHEKS